MAVDALNKESYFAESEKKGTYPTYRLEQIDYADSIYYNATTDQTGSVSHIESIAYHTPLGLTVPIRRA